MIVNPLAISHAVSWAVVRQEAAFAKWKASGYADLEAHAAYLKAREQAMDGMAALRRLKR